ncbi:hypothetical protein QQG55_0235 [Brugia pahangi]|uniref:Uncharacterized protein n=1 Tax=Brugia pahangi TaxID=6280 RepID=A0A0N4SYQ1_BRUPA|nr:unnamed protein product [Brugia pahangi]
MKNNRKSIKQRNGNSNDISVRITNTNAEISSDRSQQSISKNLSLTQEKSDSEQTQSTDEMESKTMNLTEISSKADELISKISTKDILKTSKQQILNSQLKEEKFSKKKFRDDKLNVINYQIPTNSSVRTIGNQVLPDFSQIEIAPLFAKHDDLKPIEQNLSRRKVKSVESLKAKKINRSETNRLPRRKNSEMIESVAEKIPLKKTCRIMPHWWNDQKTFVRRIIETTRYFQALNLSMNQTEQHFEIFEDENTIKILKPFNGQI